MISRCVTRHDPSILRQDRVRAQSCGGGWRGQGGGAKHTVLLLVLALISFWRKSSYSGPSSLVLSTTISLLSSDSLKMTYLYFLLSFRSL